MILIIYIHKIYVIFDTVKHKKIKIDCYFSTQKHLAIRIAFNKSDKMKHNEEYECHHCSKFYARKSTYERHIKNCSGIPGILSKFWNQKLVSFEDTLKYRGDLPFVAYCDFETTTTHEYMFDPESREMFALT